jgi:hypothetical protein
MTLIISMQQLPEIVLDCTVLYCTEGNKYAEETNGEIENERGRHVLIELKVAWSWSVLLRLNCTQLQ